MPDGKPYFQQRWVLCKVLRDSTSGLVRSRKHPGLVTESVLHGCDHRHRSVLTAVACYSKLATPMKSVGVIPDPPRRPSHNAFWTLAVLACIDGSWRVIDEEENSGFILY